MIHLPHQHIRQCVPRHLIPAQELSPVMVVRQLLQKPRRLPDSLPQPLSVLLSLSRPGRQPQQEAPQGLKRQLQER